MVIPFDYGDAVAYAVAAVAIVGGQLVRRRSLSESSSRNVTETVDEGVLAQFLALGERLTKLELELQETRAELTEVRRERDAQIEALRAAYLDALGEKDKEIASLRTSLENHRKRIKQLEDQE
jgi:predicted RNase H-like nuclease (RuvC/YqgF family)